MTEQKLTQRIEEHLALFNKDWARYKTTVAPDVVYEEKATAHRVQGADQVVAALKGWTTAYPDLAPTIMKIAACGNTAVAEITWEGTHTGPLAGPWGTIPASGTHGSVPAAIVYTFSGDTIKEIHHYFDLMTILRDIGALPAPAAVG